MQPAHSLPDMDISIRRARETDAPAIRALAERIWWAHYTDIISEAQLRYMLEWMYSDESVSQQMEQGHIFWLLEGNGTLLGYVSVEEETPGIWHIHKLYVDATRHRTGLGSRLLNHIIAEHAPKRLRLGVNRMNHKAINFYFRQSFTIQRLMDNDIGQGFVMADFLMERVLS